MELKLTTENANTIKWFVKLHAQDSRVCDELHMIEMYKIEIVYDKPVYFGMTVLGLGKLCPMDFRDNAIQNKLPRTCKQLYSDTNFFVYSTQHDTIYDWVEINMSICQIPSERI